MGDSDGGTRWGTSPLPGHDARERAADIPNGELALARFAGWYAGMRGTLYVSRSYAAFAAGGARRLLLPLAHVGGVRGAPGGRLQRAGVVVRPDAGGEFAFALARREDAPCAVRLLSVLAQRARSGARLAPLPASAGPQLAQAAAHAPDAPGLSFEPRARHRRRRARPRRRDRAFRAEDDACDADVDEVEGEREAARRRAGRARRRREAEDEAVARAVAAQGAPDMAVEAAAFVWPPGRPRKPVVERIRDAVVIVRGGVKVFKGGVAVVKDGGVAVVKDGVDVVGGMVGCVHEQMAGSGIGKWCGANLFDLILCFVAGFAMVVAIVTLRMAENYTLHLRILGISIMSGRL